QRTTSWEADLNAVDEIFQNSDLGRWQRGQRMRVLLEASERLSRAGGGTSERPKLLNAVRKLRTPIPGDRPSYAFRCAELDRELGGAPAVVGILPIGKSLRPPETIGDVAKEWSRGNLDLPSLLEKVNTYIAKGERVRVLKSLDKRHRILCYVRYLIVG